MSALQHAADPLKLVEECSGVGEVSSRGRVIGGIPYRVKRLQGMLPSGLPVPGLHRIEGRIDLADVPERRTLVDAQLTLRLEDGRSLRLTLLDEDGRVLAEGHGPSKCTCC